MTATEIWLSRFDGVLDEVSRRCKLERMLFVYAKDGHVCCLSADEAMMLKGMGRMEGWKHTATIDPARWIEALVMGSGDPSDALDELQLGP